MRDRETGFDSDETQPISPEEAGHLVGRTVGRYQVESRIGAGGMGEVFRAWDPTLKRHVALKRVSERALGGAGRVRQLLREARALSGLNHPSIATIHDIVTEGNESFLVEEFVDGTSLLIRLRDGFSTDEFLTIAEGCLSALEAAAAQGILHCDLKPENILVDSDGVPRILDFGLARRMDVGIAGDQSDSFLPRVDSHDGLAGTPPYMAPEVVSGLPVDASSDVYSLGVVFYEMVTGTSPFRRDTARETLQAVVRHRPPPPRNLVPDLPADIDRLIRHMMDPNPSTRSGSATDLLNSVRTIRASTGRNSGSFSRLLSIWGLDRVPRRGWSLLIATVVTTMVASVILWPRSFDGYLTVHAFESLSTDSDDRFLALGVTEALRVHLAGLGGVHVVDGGQDLGTDIALRGTVQREGDRLRVTYRVMDQHSGETLGGDVTEGSADAVFALQSTVAASVGAILAGRWKTIGTLDDEARPTEDDGAYDLYVRALGHLRGTETGPDYETAILLFNDALDRDENFALARAGLARAHWALFRDGRDPEHAKLAEENAHAVIQTSPDLPEAHLALGQVLAGTGRPEAAENAYEEVLDLEPENALALRNLARAQAAQGRLEEAEATHLLAIRKNPKLWGGHTEYGIFLYSHGRIEEAVKPFLEVTNLLPDYAGGHANLAAMYQLTGDAKRAVASYDRSIAIRPTVPALSNLGLYLKSLHRLEDAASRFEEALEINDSDYRVWGNYATVLELIPEREDEGMAAYARALSGAEELLQVDPGDAGLLVNLAQYLMALGRNAEARVRVDAALLAAPRDMNVAYAAAGVFSGVGDVSRALEVLTQALDLGLPLQQVLDDPSLDPVRALPGFDELQARFAAEARASESQQRKSVQQ